MATVADLRMRPSMRHAHVLLIDGTPFAFTDEYALSTLAGMGWWTPDDRVVLNGLVVPKGLTDALEVESGQFQDDGVTFQLIDFDETTIPRFFGGLSKTFKQLGERLSPLMDPCPAVLLDSAFGELEPWGGYIGTEAIGPAGERNYYSAFFWGGLPGQDHPADGEPYPVFTDSATGPYLVEGRHVSLHRILWDPDENEWKSIEDNLAAGVLPLWFGTLRQAGEVDGRVWAIDCAGPGSFLRKSLNTRTSTTWYPVTADLVLSLDERRIKVQFTKIQFDNAAGELNGSNDSYLVDPLAVFESVKGAVESVATEPGDGGYAFVDASNTGAGSITWNKTISITMTPFQGWAGRMYLELHGKVWRMLGFDPIALEENLEEGSPFFEAELPELPGHYRAWFSTTPAPEHPLIPTGDIEWVGEGPRSYKATYEGGISILTGSGGQVIRIRPPDGERIYCEGQTSRPVALSTIYAGDTTSSRWWAFKGKIQLEGDSEPSDTVQVARCSWVEYESGFVAPDESGITCGLVIDKWLDPRLFGFNYKPISPKLGWASRDNPGDDESRQISCSPLAVFAQYNGSADRASTTIKRILLSTGSAFWGLGSEDSNLDADLADQVDSYLTEGSNGPGDREIADLSLGLPSSLVDVSSLGAADDDLPSGSSSPLALHKVAVHGPIQAEELLEAIMAPRGWSWSLIRGRFGVWSQHVSSEEAFVEGVDISITPDDLAGEAGDPGSCIPSVGLRPVFPFERLAVSHTGDPIEGWLDGQVDLSLKARDIGARARMGNRERSLSCPDLIETSWFVDSATLLENQVPTWIGEFRSLWERTIPSWLARPHRLIQGLRVSRPKGQDLGVGSVVRLTLPWPANSFGSYGMTNVSGRVISCTIETDTCVSVVDVLAEATAPDALRWAPILRVVDEGVDDTSDRYDAGTRTFYLRDWGGVDVATQLQAVIKPDDLDAEDDTTLLTLLGFNGVRWVYVGRFFASAVNTMAKTLTVEAWGDGNLNDSEGFTTANFPPRMYLFFILSPLTSSENWTYLRYARHTPNGGDGVQRKLGK